MKVPIRMMPSESLKIHGLYTQQRTNCTQKRGFLGIKLK